MIRIILLTLLILSTGCLAHAQTPDAVRQQADMALLESSAPKINAYMALLNQTLRASEAIERYEGWVDMDKGPTGKKKRILGIYALYDVTNLIADALEASNKDPKFSELDTSMRAYIEAYLHLALIIGEANGYYERNDYLYDNLARGKQIHARLAPAVEIFLTARAKVEHEFQAKRMYLAQRELAVIERLEGRKANWHLTNLMTAAGRIIHQLPSNEKPVINVAALSANVTFFADAFKSLDEYRESDPQALENLQFALRSFLASAREFRDTMKPIDGDIRRGGKQQAQTLSKAYNALVASANKAAE